MHAYLIIAHNEFEVLQKLLQALDDKRNDIYVHIDKKVKTLPTLSVTQSRLYLLDKRVDVRWGTVSQIKAEYRLMEEAYRQGGYDYYHIISGTHYPLKSQDELHAYFDGLGGKSLLQPMESSEYQEDLKFRRYNVCTNGFHHPKLWVALATQFVWKTLIRIQKMCHIKRHKTKKYYKASQWVSLGEKHVQYLLINSQKIIGDYKFTFCADEYFIPTELRYGNMENSIVNTEKMLFYDMGKAETAFFTLDDFYRLTNCDCMFARKFSKHDIILVDRINEWIKR